MACTLTGSSCATVDQLIAFIPDLKTYGPPSSGTLTLDGETLVGETLTIGGITLTAVAGVAGNNQWSVDGDEYAELNSLVSSINLYAGAVVTASVRTPGLLIINLDSVSTGAYSNLPMSTTSPNITLSGSTLTGGECDLEFFLATACSMISKQCFGTKTLAASMYLAAHLIEISNGGDSGALTSRSIDKISEGFAYVSPDVNDAYYANTKWGRLYLALYKTIPKMPVVGGGLVPRSWCSYYYGRRGRC